MPVTRSRRSIAAAAAAVVLSSQFVLADTATSQWSGAVNSVWSETGNWAGGVPSTTVGSVLDGTFSNMPGLTANQSALGLWLKTGVAQDLIINADAARTLNLTAGATLNNLTGVPSFTGGTAILMDDAANHNLTFGPNVNLAPGNSTAIINNSAGTLTIQGSIAKSNGTGVVFAGNNAAGVVEISGALVNAGGGSFRVNTAGTVILSGDSSSYASAFQLYGGTVRLTNANALKAAAVNLGTTSGTTLLQLRSDNDQDSFITTGSLTVNNTGSTINVDRLTAGGGSNKTLKLANVTLENNAILTLTGDNGYGLSIGALALGNGFATTSTLNPTSATLTVGNVAPRQVMTNGTQNFALGGTTTGNSITGVISNHASGAYSTLLRKVNTSTWTVSGANTYTNLTAIENGTLRATNNNALGFGGVARPNDTGALTIGTGFLTTSTLDLANVTVNKPITLNQGSIINSATGTTSTIGTGVSSVSFTAAGVGSGFAAADLNHALTLSGTGTGAAAQISALRANDSTIANVLNTGTGWVTGNTITLTGGGASQSAVYNVTATGGVITGLTLATPGYGYTGLPTGITGAKGSASPAFAGAGVTPTFNDNFSVASITTTAMGSGYTAAPTVSISGVSGTGLVATGQFSNVILQGTAANNKIGGDGNLIIDAVVSGSSGFVKIGNGFVSLNGANSYTAGTTVTAGTLFVNNATGSGTGSGAVTVNGGTLGGNGFISGAVTITSGGLAPGNSAGELDFGSSLVLGGTTTMEIFGASRGVDDGYDAINVTGAMTYGGDLVVNFAGVPASDQAYHLFDFASFAAGSNFSSIMLTGAYTGALTDPTNSGNWQGSIGGGEFTFTRSDGVLNVTVPEPGTVAMALGVICVGCMRRQRRPL